MNNVEQHRMLRETTPPDFLDSSVEWRRIFSETWGDVPVGRGSPDADVVAAKNGGAVTLGMAVVALCMMVMVVIYFTGIPKVTAPPFFAATTSASGLPRPTGTSPRFPKKFAAIRRTNPENRGASKWRRIFSETWGTFLLVVVAQTRT